MSTTPKKRRRRGQKNKALKYKLKSKFEAKIQEELTRSGVVGDLQYEPHTFEYTLIKRYTPDFLLPNGVYVEAKGLFDPDDRRKHLEIRKQHPHLDIRIVFSRDNYIRRGSKTRYTDWCHKHGIQCAVGSVPEEWLKDNKNNKEEAANE